MTNKGFTMIESLIVVSIILTITIIVVCNVSIYKSGDRITLKATGDTGTIISVLRNTELHTIQYSILLDSKTSVIVDADSIQKVEKLER